MPHSPIFRLLTIVVLWTILFLALDGRTAFAAQSPFSTLTPPLLQNIAQVSAGGSHTCVVTQSGGVKCWGENIGELGIGTKGDNISLPMNVVGLSSGVSSVASGDAQTCALLTNGGV